MFHVVTGGSGSGKSAYAEEQICMLQKKRQIPVICIILQPWSLMGKRQNKRSCATDRCEMEKDLRRWNVLQILRSWCRPSRVFRADATEEGICVLLECMSNLTANELYLDTGAKERTREAVLEGIRELEKTLPGTCGSHK